MISPYEGWQWCRQKMHTDGVGKVAARQGKHYSRGYVTSEKEERYYRHYIFKINDASGSIVLQRRSRKALQISFY